MAPIAKQRKRPKNKETKSTSRQDMLLAKSPAAKPCWDVLFCMIFYEWNGKLFDRTISVPGTG